MKALKRFCVRTSIYVMGANTQAFAQTSASDAQTIQNLNVPTSAVQLVKAKLAYFPINGFSPTPINGDTFYILNKQRTGLLAELRVTRLTTTAKWAEAEILGDTTPEVIKTFTGLSVIRGKDAQANATKLTAGPLQLGTTPKATSLPSAGTGPTLADGVRGNPVFQTSVSWTVMPLPLADLFTGIELNFSGYGVGLELATHLPNIGNRTWTNWFGVSAAYTIMLPKTLTLQGVQGTSVQTTTTGGNQISSKIFFKPVLKPWWARRVGLELVPFEQRTDTLDAKETQFEPKTTSKGVTQGFGVWLSYEIEPADKTMFQLRGKVPLEQTLTLTENSSAGNVKAEGKLKAWAAGFALGTRALLGAPNSLWALDPRVFAYYQSETVTGLGAFPEDGRTTKDWTFGASLAVSLDPTPASSK